MPIEFERSLSFQIIEGGWPTFYQIIHHELSHCAGNWRYNVMVLPDSPPTYYTAIYAIRRYSFQGGRVFTVSIWAAFGK